MLRKFRFALVALFAAGLLFSLSNVSSAYEEAPARVTVQVTALGAPVRGADVSVGESSDVTGINGNYVFVVSKGTYTVSVADHHDNTDSREVRVHPGEIIQVTFDLGAAGRPATGDH